MQAQATAPSVVEARSFVLVEKAGRKRGEWKLDSAGEPVLQLLDPAGHPIWEAGKMKMRPLSR